MVAFSYGFKDSLKSTLIYAYEELKWKSPEEQRARNEEIKRSMIGARDFVVETIKDPNAKAEEIRSYYQSLSEEEKAYLYGSLLGGSIQAVSVRALPKGIRAPGQGGASSSVSPSVAGQNTAGARMLESPMAGDNQGSLLREGEEKGGNSPDFVVTPKGDVIPIPKGATGPNPVVNPKGNVTGQSYNGGQGGANKQVDSVRIMEPTPPRGNSPGYPGGYIKYENKGQQGVDPITGKTIPNSQSHIPLKD